MTTLENIIARSQNGEQTRRLYLSCVRSYEKFMGTSTTYTTASVENWRDALKARGLAASTINTKMAALRYASRRYQVLGYGADFARAAELLREGGEKKRRSLTQEQTEQLVAACEGTRPYDFRDRALIITALRTGLRREEIVAMEMNRWERASTSRIRVKLKGGTWHWVTLDPEADRALYEWSTWLGYGPGTSGRIFRSIRPSVTGNYKIGKSLSASGFYKILRERAGDAGIKKIFPHILRHTFISLALANGVTPERVAAAVGWKSLSQIMRYMTDLEADTRPVGSSLPRMRRR